MGTNESGYPFVVIQDLRGRVLAATSNIRSAIDAALAQKEK
jgi:hypothetical protein